MMQASGKGREESGGSENCLGGWKPRPSVQDLPPDDFKKAWIKIKEVHDKEIYRLQSKLTNMRRALLAERRRLGSLANSQLLEPQDSTSSKTCNRCLMNETFSSMLQKELTNTQQERLVQISELRAENIKLKEQNRKLSERLRATLPRYHICFSDSSDDSNPCVPVTKEVYRVKSPLPTGQEQLPSIAVKAQGEKKKATFPVEVTRTPEMPVKGHEKDIRVSETSFIETSSADNHTTKKPKVYESFYSKAKDNPTQKEDVNMGGRVSTNTSSPGNKPIVTVPETSEENMPSSPTTDIVTIRRKREAQASYVFPVDYTSKYTHRRYIGNSSINRDDISVEPTEALLSPEPSTSKNTAESSNVVCRERKRKINYDKALLESRLKRKVFQ